MPGQDDAAEPPFRKAILALGDDSVVVTRPLVTRELTPTEYLVGSEDVRRFVELDAEALHATRLLDGKRTIKQVQEELTAAHGGESDVRAFVRFLAERQLIASADGVPATTVVPPHSFLNRIPSEPLRWLHHPLIGCTVLLLLAAWLGMVAARPELRPSYSDMFVVDRPLGSFALVVGGLLGMAYLHELAHFFMAKSYGVQAKIGVSHRIMMLVLETDVTNAWTLERRQRVAVFLSGMALNVLVLASSGLVAGVLLVSGMAVPSDLSIRLLKLLVMVNVMPLVFQFFLFSRTDLYYVLAAGWGERNLAADARAYWKHVGTRIYRRWSGTQSSPCTACGTVLVKGDPFCLRCGASSGDLRTADSPQFRHGSIRRLRAFGVFMAIGYAYATWFMVIIVPRLIALIYMVGVKAAFIGHANGEWLLLAEAAVFMLVNLAQVALIGWMVFARVVRGAVFLVTAIRLVLVRLAFGPKASTP